MNEHGEAEGNRSFVRSGEGFAQIKDWIVHHCDSFDAVRVAIEVPNSTVVDSLLSYVPEVCSMSSTMPRRDISGVISGCRQCSIN